MEVKIMKKNFFMLTTCFYWLGSTAIASENVAATTALAGTNGSLVSGVYYMVQSHAGHYLDMRQETGEEAFPVWGITDSRRQTYPAANDSFQVRFVDRGNGYCMLQSKFGRYLDLRNHDIYNDHYPPAWSITGTHTKNHFEAFGDSFQFRFIDRGNGTYMLQSKFGRYLDLGQDDKNSGDAHEALAITESYMRNHMRANSGFFLRFIPKSGYKLTGTLLNFSFNQNIDDLMNRQKKLLLAASSTIHNPEGSRATETQSFLHTCVVEEQATITFEEAKSDFLEKFSTFDVSSSNYTQQNSSTRQHRSCSSYISSLFDLIRTPISRSTTESDNRFATSHNSSSRKHEESRQRNVVEQRGSNIISKRSRTQFTIKTELKAKEGAHIKKDHFVEKVDDLQIPFMATLKVGVVSEDNPECRYNAQAVKFFMEHEGFFSSELADDTSAIYIIRGYINASLGLNTYTSIENLQAKPIGGVL
jgi:hypothetical protein